MTYLFINTATNEYPRHPGDVALDPNAPWAPVEDVPMPEIGERQLVVEKHPTLVDGSYMRTWEVITYSEEEWAALMERNKAEREKARLSLFPTTPIVEEPPTA